MPTPTRRLRCELLEDRLTPAAGDLDASFGDGGKVVLGLGPNVEPNAAIVQPDGKVVVAGTTDGTAAGTDFLIARLGADGALDPSFGTGGVRTIDFGGQDIATGLALLSDGRIVVSGTGSTVIGGATAVARLNPDGTDDVTFAGTGRRTIHFDSIYFYGSAVAVGPLGGVYLAGSSGGNMGVARLDPLGNLDTAFGTNGVKTIDLTGSDLSVSYTPTALTVLPDGRVVLSGHNGYIPSDPVLGVPPPPPRPVGFVAIRLAADGSAVDSGFGNTVLNGTKVAMVGLGSGFGTSGPVAALQPDGDLLLAGPTIPTGTDAADFAVARLTPTGQLDPSFNGTGTRVIDFGQDDVALGLTLQSDGRIVVGGRSEDPRAPLESDFAVARLNRDGSDDLSFGGPHTFDLGGSDRALAVGLDPLGRITLAGVSGLGNSSDLAVARVVGSSEASRVLLASGAPDGSVLQYIPSDDQYAAGPTFTAFPGFAGPVRVTAVDVTGDGVPERVVGAGPGGGPGVAVFDGATGVLLADFFAFEPTFTGGVLVAGGDLTGDGRAELVVAAGAGGGPRVRVFDGASLVVNDPVALTDFFAIDDPAFRGGARPALGDVNGDGTPDLVVSAGFGGGPRVALFDGKSLADTPV
ncbi:MAG TPA: FG-GAP-like repeat-containing protein, partial [Fimbriiglobus sp.]|nr:FG-GAP-like repeat-containing protein [Fimbriiglobus sp.]